MTISKTDNVDSYEAGEGLIASKLQDNARSIALPDSWLELYKFRSTATQGIKRESPSSLINFINCPASWFADRHSPVGQKAQFKPSQYSVAGDFAHRCLELFYELEPEERTEDMLEAIIGDVFDAIDSGDVAGGIIDASMIWSYRYALEHPFGRTRSHEVKPFIRDVGAESAMSIFDFEDPEDVDVHSQEAWSNITVNGITFSGKTDRVDATGLTTRSIVDYKTGRFKGDKHNVSIDDMEFFKSGMYSIMEDGDVEEVRQVYLKEMLNFRFAMPQYRKDFVRRVIDDATQQMNDIERTGRVIYRPSPKATEGHCRYCPLVSACPAWNRGKKDLDLSELVERASR